jgi:Spy/CpxP family protein refolding chaperone
VFRHHLAALALAGAMVLPFTASAQLAPGPSATGPAATSTSAPGRGFQGRRGFRRRDPYMRIMRGLNLTDAQKQQIATIERNTRATERQQIEGVLTDAQRAQLRAKLAQLRPQGQPNATQPNTLQPGAPRPTPRP